MGEGVGGGQPERTRAVAAGEGRAGFVASTKDGVRVGRVGLQREMAASGSVPCEKEARVVCDGEGYGHIHICVQLKRASNDLGATAGLANYVFTACS